MVCDLGRHPLFLCFCIFTMLLPISAFAQDPTPSPILPPEDFVVPPARTITAPLKPAPPKRIVDIHFFDEQHRACVDTFKIEASRKIIYAGQSVTFRSSISRKCNQKSVTAPIPIKVDFFVRSLNSKKNSPDSSQSVTPQSSSNAFSQTFNNQGSYQITVVHHINDSLTHTVSLSVPVLPPKINAPAPENTD